MRKAKDIRRIGCCACGPQPLRVAAVVAFSMMLWCSKSMGCHIRDVWLYVGEDADEAASQTRTKQFMCTANDSYGFRAKWSAFGSKDTWTVRIYEFGWWITYQKENIAKSKREWVDEITSPGSLSQGIHYIHAFVAMVDDGDWYDIEWSGLDTIAIDADPGEYTGWTNVTPDEDCPPGSSCPTSTVAFDPLNDGCDHTLQIKCAVVSSGCRYEWFYDGAPIGVCPWKGGGNAFWYMYTSKNTWGKKRFLETKHISFNDGEEPLRWGPDEQGEACTGYYCARFQRHNCMTNTMIGVDWKKTAYDWWWPALDVEGTEWWFEDCSCSPNEHYFCPN